MERLAIVLRRRKKHKTGGGFLCQPRRLQVFYFISMLAHSPVSI
jgi:hypothetical protein